MLRTICKQNKGIAAVVSRTPSLRMSFSTNAAEVFDTEANRQQLEIISQQMEEAMQKEKQQQHLRFKQVSVSVETWDTHLLNPKRPEDLHSRQRHSHEIDAVFYEKLDPVQSMEQEVKETIELAREKAQEVLGKNGGGKDDHSEIGKKKKHEILIS